MGPIRKLFIKILCLSLSERKKIIAAHSLNRWVWPKSLELVRPKWYVGSDGSDRKFYEASWVRKFLESRIKDKKASWFYHWKEYLKYDDLKCQLLWEVHWDNPNRRPLTEEELKIERLAFSVLSGINRAQDKYRPQDISKQIKQSLFCDQLKENNLLN